MLRARKCSQLFFMKASHIFIFLIFFACGEKPVAFEEDNLPEEVIIHPELKVIEPTIGFTP